jgi:hypothetical protein
VRSQQAGEVRAGLTVADLHAVLSGVIAMERSLPAEHRGIGLASSSKDQAAADLPGATRAKVNGAFQNPDFRLVRCECLRSTSAWPADSESESLPGRPFTLCSRNFQRLAHSGTPAGGVELVGMRSCTRQPRLPTRRRASAARRPARSHRSTTRPSSRPLASNPRGDYVSTGVRYRPTPAGAGLA